MSLGEMESWRPDFAAVKASGVLLDENPHWPGSYFVDIRNPAWQKRILDTLAPAVWTQGFHGFFLDTLDDRSEEHTSELQSLMRISYADFCLKTKKQTNSMIHDTTHTQ